MDKLHYTLHIEGLVQGVGFRPFVYKLATGMNLCGNVSNRTDGVYVDLNASSHELESFVERLKTEKPEVAFIYKINVHRPEPPIRYDSFEIIHSIDETSQVTQVSPDIAVCEDCMADIQSQQHRLRYPFVNCTHCGPRFSIVKALPYDRANTTMQSFAMCRHCNHEYHDVSDRRFHAQPTACNSCGPVYYIHTPGDFSYPEILDRFSAEVNAGNLVAVRGVGGYHLVCDATNPKAVAKLRALKQRDSKPFAVLFSSLEAAKAYTYIDKEEEALLSSWRRPIVLLKQKRALAEGVNDGLATLGCMLPSQPIHYHWFDQLNTEVLVMTSGNCHSEPIYIAPQTAEEQLGAHVSLFIHHNRDIQNRVDDSVVAFTARKPVVYRRSRGYVPEPLFTPRSMDGIVAFGAELCNTFAVGKANQLIVSQHIGDLKNWDTFAFYQESLTRFAELFHITPRVLACDMHPEYLSSKFALEYALAKDLPLIHVQHHHAHAAACMLEHNLDEEVLAIILDGVGYGTDDTSWGGEVFRCDYSKFTRLAHFTPISLPGGDIASHEPWRMAVAYVHELLPEAKLPDVFIKRIGEKRIEMLRKMIDQRINSPRSSGAGRLFDAVSSLISLCDTNTFQAEAAIKLEHIADQSVQDLYEIDAEHPLDATLLLQGVLTDIEDGVSSSVIAMKFHNTLAEMLFQTTCFQLEKEQLQKVVLSGGCFQNKLLLELLVNKYDNAQILSYFPEQYPCNDGAISVGQAAIVASLYQH